MNEATRPEPAWVTLNATPPIVTVPLREPPVFAGAVMVTVPLPVPDAGETVANADADESATAVHAHAEFELVTVTVAVLAVAARLALVGESVTVHVAGAFGDSCVKLMAVPPIVTDPLRAGP